MLKCEHCGKQVKDKRGLSAHVRCHCPVLHKKGNDEKPKKKQEKKAALECDCKDGGAWEYLDADDPQQGSVMAIINPDTGKGYKKWCTKCREAV